MGTKVHCKSYLPGYYSMRDLNEDSSSGSWPFYGDKTLPNTQYYNGFMPRTLTDNNHSGHDKDTLKQKMLEHEAVFKNQVCELHRLYRIQRDMMEEVKRKEVHKNHQASNEASSSSSLHGSQAPSEKWHMAGFPLLNSNYGQKSISGVAILDSPMSSTKGNNTQFPFPNGYHTSKDFSEALDSRPLKVRKKLFDLQIPADGYLDSEEGGNLLKYRDFTASNGTPSNRPKSDVKLVLDSKGSTGLADLNEPVEVEETTPPLCVDFPGHNSETKGKDQPAKSNGGYVGAKGETISVRDGFFIKSRGESSVNERGQLSHVYEAGSIRNNLSSVTQGHQPVQGMLNHVHHPPGIYSSHCSGDNNLWGNGFQHGLESFDRSFHHSNKSQLEPIPTQTLISYPFFSPSNSVPSWAKPTTNFAQKITTPLETAPLNSPAATSRAFQPSILNGFYHASSSGSKELHFPSPGFGNFSSRADSKPAIDINLNEAITSKGEPNEKVVVQDLNMEDGKSKPECHLSAPHWLKPKPAHANEPANQSCPKIETVRDLNQPFISKKEIAETHKVKKILGFPIYDRDRPDDESSPLASTSASIDLHHEIKGQKRIIDVNIACEPEENNNSIVASEEPTAEREKGFDLNSCVSDCEEYPPLPSLKATVKTKTLEIDLEEIPVLLENEEDSTLSKENTPEEVISLQQSASEMIKTQDDEVLRHAAETMLSISSSCPKVHTDESSLAEALILFANAVTTHKRKEKEMDDFEAMTLQLAETKEEDYIPQNPFLFQELPKGEEDEKDGKYPSPSRPRRGQSRRGRQRRDFQRDILPGLASLSRHEVTEDLQTFGGLMKATGHSWNSGLARRNGGGRGRRRPGAGTVQPVVRVPICDELARRMNGGGLEDRSLTGWGKTTRRPRRQRCPAAGGINTQPTVVLMQ